MATVWAPYHADGIGTYHDRAYASGWSHTIHHHGFYNLTRQMAERNLERSVTRLGIVAHGDTSGVIQLGRVSPDRPERDPQEQRRNLTVLTLDSFAKEIGDLQDFLTARAELIFYSCAAGAQAAGDRLLEGISRLLPGRTVVGFTVYAAGASSNDLSGLSPMTPGALFPSMGLRGMRIEGHGTVDPHDVFAKWARDGRIVRRPPVERDAQGRCANPRCPGHADLTHHCLGWP
ncbi:DUF4347 domain-containing protein [Jannaschia aquimarina]|uniref:DUF4347 domain-containing protein n=1 Tax=Jannaschia aquimarina TaxID=935700 RepID=A0A0D1CJL7_9RHOB|nr:DUF4347 domain-containing protein [Jannaschia aquimarina]KIT14897.1 hypothetical protein jaqu_32220 [Jannaschia aquimarina]SNS58738.1 protein of unknown function [Jannaschia aquimarina]